MQKNEWQSRGKETSPEETVNKIKKILKDNHFEYEYEEMESGIGECYSSRLTLIPPGDGIMGTNGKGMNRSLCAASAFGEMMERMSNVSLSNFNFKDPKKKEISGDQGRFYSIYGENQPDCIKKMKQKIMDSMGDPVICSKELMLNSTLSRMCGGDKIPEYPFYSVEKKCVEYLPIDLIKIFTGTNGMAAGNTIPEAVVEGASEILERYVQDQVIFGGVRLTRLPDDVLAKYPHIVNIIHEIESDGTKTVMLLDASIGKKLPVMCGICISHNTGTVGVKFGAHPNMAVAIERIFTEGTQGRNIETFSKINTISFENDYEGKRFEHWLILKNGIGSMPAELLMPYDSSHYIPWDDFTKESNQQVMWKLIDLLESIGGDVYIRDSSVLGFPAVYIYAAGVSEVEKLDWTTVSIVDAVIRRQYIMTHLEEAEDRDIRALALIFKINPAVLEVDEYSYLMGVPMKCRMPGEHYQSHFLRGMCEYYLGNIEEAQSIIEGVLNIIGQDREYALEKAIEAYLSGLRYGFEKDHIEQIIKNLYPDFWEKVIDIMSNPKEVLKKLYPICNRFDCDNCNLRNICKYPETRSVTEKLYKAFNKYQPSDEEICDTFKR